MVIICAPLTLRATRARVLGTWAGLSACYSLARHRDRSDCVPTGATVSVPTIVYFGDQTLPGLPEAADAVAALPKAQRHVLLGQDHGPAPEAIVPELVKFLALGGFSQGCNSRTAQGTLARHAGRDRVVPLSCWSFIWWTPVVEIRTEAVERRSSARPDRWACRQRDNARAVIR